MLGYVGEISQDELDAQSRRSYRPGDKIGKAGVEARLDEYLRGEAGIAQIRVDSLGARRARSSRGGTREPGYAVRLTIDMQLQRAAEQALRYGIRTARENDSYYANGGAIVALDPRDGAVLAMASYADVQAVGLRRPGRPEEDRSRSSTRRRPRKRELPGHQPRDDRSPTRRGRPGSR